MRPSISIASAQHSARFVPALLSQHVAVNATAPKRLRYVLVNVIGVAGICREQVLDVSEIGPVIVETTPKTTVIVPASRPEQDG